MGSFLYFFNLQKYELITIERIFLCIFTEKNQLVMEKLYLLDAYALIYRAYYALIRSPRMNPKGENTSAIFGFVNTLEEVLRKEKPD
jgi:hypothetical protein